MSTQNKVAVVTGGSAGIGEATARALANDGYTVVVAARRLERCEDVAREIDGVAVRLDVGDDGGVERLRAAVEELGRCDVLVNNAGGAKGLDDFKDANLEDWAWMYEVNVLGTVRVTNALYPLLVASEGLIVNIGSVAAWEAYPGGAGYNAAKFGLRAATRAMRREEAGNPIRITEIDPGRVETDFSINRFKGDEARAAQVYEGKMNLTAEDVAEAVRWVASLPKHVNVDTLNIMPRAQAEGGQAVSYTHLTLPTNREV